MKSNIITNVEVNEQIIQVRLKNVEKNPLFVAQIFKIISSYGVNIDMISNVKLEDEMRIDFTTDEACQKELNKAVLEVQKEHPRIEIYSHKNVGKISIEGNMENETGVAAEIFGVFGDNQIPFRQVTTSKTTMDFVVDKQYLRKAGDLLKEIM